LFFDSIIYFVFLVGVVSLYWRLPHRKQNIFLLAASYFFYGWWDWRFLLLMAGSTFIDFLIARKIQSSENEKHRKTLLVISLVLNFGFLGFFKYFNFFVNSFEGLLQTAGIHYVPIALLKIILPPGISFYTFQEVAYIVDVYYRKLRAADSLVEYAVFISLFPHLIAGPIQRPSHLLPQVQKPRMFEGGKFFDGLLLILSGLFRKCVIADNCALIANAAFSGSFGAPSLPVLLIGTYAFAWQIYGDFSGYSDIARGSAQLLGFHFMVNFRQPYLAQSLQDFWRRWHISLSTWLRDYLYIPLGGNRKGEKRTYFNLLATMLLGGLWHGANWTFVTWGGIHGAGLALERFLGVADGATTKAASWLSIWLRRILLFHVVCFSWIFFRAQSVAESLHFLSGITSWEWRPEYLVALEFLGLFSIPLLLLDLQLEKSGCEYAFANRTPAFRVAFGLALFLGVTYFSASDTHAFIYFQF
jgi:D-alanyl-lipoteichoic acid acyltransferase DltB (MBOAT superfamily)